MTVTYREKDYRVYSIDREKIEKRLAKYDKFFRTPAEATVTIKKGRVSVTAEVTITSGNLVLRAEKSDDDALSAIDQCCEALERQLRKNKTKLENKYKSAGAPVLADFDGDVEEEDLSIMRIKQVTLRPMSPEEAVLQMNLVGHDFFVFYNVDTSSVCVVYHRKDGGYGLIEPAF
ncbi:MAG: ribosome-associated translation inhibitor RaiA [Clostridia bacterium]|nr:ribosome-associated translation inhibitor RaiA [Clostridia bacterium]